MISAGLLKTLMITLTLVFTNDGKSIDSPEIEMIQTLFVSGKEFILVTNSAYYEAAEDDCATLYGGNLATIKSKVELDAITKLLKQGSVTSVWVGAEICRNPYCSNPRQFDDDCWIWVDGKGIAAVQWDPCTTKKWQTAASRVYLDPHSNTLKLDYNTGTRRFLCEKASSNEPVEEEVITKSLYLSSNSAEFWTAMDDCKYLYGGTLVTIETPKDLEMIYYILRPGSVTSVWAGAVINMDKGCLRPQIFESSCWSWISGSCIVSKVISWDPSTIEKYQNSKSPVYFDRLTGALNIDRNNATRRYLCERTMLG